MVLHEMLLDEWLPQIPKEEYEQFIEELHGEIKDLEQIIRKNLAQASPAMPESSSTVIDPEEHEDLAGCTGEGPDHRQ